MNYRLAPSILAADFNRLGQQIRQVEEAGVTDLHFDVMDGMFVPSISFGMPVLASIRKETSLQLDVHLMILDPLRYIETFVNCGADSITVHAEACEDLPLVIQKIRDCGCKAAVSINPATELGAIEAVLPLVDMVLLMTVNPGFGGQKYIESSAQKIKELRTMINSKGLDVDIQVDGGINKENVQVVLDAGANVIVAGTAVFGGTIPENAKEFLHIFEQQKG